MAKTKKKKAYAGVPRRQWNDWRWQIRNRLTRLEDVVRVLNPSKETIEGIKIATRHFRMAITPYYASLIDIDNPYCPIKAQAIPSASEAEVSKSDMADPLQEDRDSPVEGLTHRYPDRALLLVTDVCSMYCRHCTRRRLVGHRDYQFDLKRIRPAIDYIAGHSEIRDVVVSGGDPLIMSGAGLGSFQLPLSTHAIAMSGHVRVGIEDNIYIRKGELAQSNAQLVERVVRIAKELDRAVAGVKEAKDMLGL